MAQKRYCYVDESGQDTQGELFIVAVVVAGDEREHLRQACTEIEAASRKGARKWAKSNQERRLAYVQDILRREDLHGKLYFGIHQWTQDYLNATVQTIVSALSLSVMGKEYKATILIDGLPRSTERNVALLLRRSGLPVQKVRGIDEESEPLIRLADALCGFVRSAREGNDAMLALFEAALNSGFVIDLTGK